MRTDLSSTCRPRRAIVSLAVVLAVLATAQFTGAAAGDSGVRGATAQDGPELFLLARGKLAIAPNGRIRCRSARVKLEVRGADRELAESAAFFYGGRRRALDRTPPLAGQILGLEPRRAGLRSASARVRMADSSVVELRTTVRLCARSADDQ